MTSLFKTPRLLHPLINPTSSFLHPSSPLLLSFPFHSNPSTLHPRLSPLKAAASDGDNLLGKPLLQQQQQQQHDNDILPIKTTTTYAYEEVEVEEDEDDDGAEEDRWVDWEDQILEDTVPLVGFVRTILHSGKYESGERLSPEHEKAILEKLLPFHPEHEKKIGCGIDYITIGYHPNFDRSRCLFIVRKDGELVDFSYWKCIKGLIRKNYPLYADSFILRHFRKRSPSL